MKGSDIAAYEDKLKGLKDKELEEQKKQEEEKSGKKTYDIKKILE